MLPFGSIRTVLAALRSATACHEGVGRSPDGNRLAGGRERLVHREGPGRHLTVHASRQVGARE